jgi:hypothetical protein
MATYLQGVTDYIPEYQPFQPDFNFFASALQVKQNQYDKNWSRLNKVYSQFMNAPLTHQQSIKNRDQYMKNSIKDIQKISGLDLSLDQNVQQAMQVFTPFYNDKNFLYDMHFTQTANQNRSTGLGYQNCTGEDCDGMYWNEGIEAIDYKVKEFGESNYDQIFNISAPTYTPYYKGLDAATKIIKDLNIDIKSTTIQDGNIITYRNGEIAKIPLYQAIQTGLGEDPRFKKMYETQSYVERMRFVESQMAAGVSKEEAEKTFVDNTLAMYGAMITDEAEKTKSQTNSLLQMAGRAQNIIDSIGMELEADDPLVQSAQTIQKEAQMSNGLHTTAESFLSALNTATGSPAIQNPSGIAAPPAQNITANLRIAESIRAQALMTKDFVLYADNLSNRNYEYKVSRDPLAIQREANDAAMNRLKYKLWVDGKIDINGNPIGAGFGGIGDGSILPVDAPDNAGAETPELTEDAKKIVPKEVIEKQETQKEVLEEGNYEGLQKLSEESKAKVESPGVASSLSFFNTMMKKAISGDDFAKAQLLELIDVYANKNDFTKKYAAEIKQKLGGSFEGMLNPNVNFMVKAQGLTAISSMLARSIKEGDEDLINYMQNGILNPNVQGAEFTPEWLNEAFTNTGIGTVLAESADKAAFNKVLRENEDVVAVTAFQKLRMLAETENNQDLLFTMANLNIDKALRTDKESLSALINDRIMAGFKNGVTNYKINRYPYSTKTADGYDVRPGLITLNTGTGEYDIPYNGDSSEALSSVKSFIKKISNDTAEKFLKEYTKSYGDAYEVAVTNNTAPYLMGSGMLTLGPDGKLKALKVDASKPRSQGSTYFNSFIANAGVFNANTAGAYGYSYGDSSKNMLDAPKGWSPKLLGFLKTSLEDKKSGSNFTVAPLPIVQGTRDIKGFKISNVSDKVLTAFATAQNIDTKSEDWKIFKGEIVSNNGIVAFGNERTMNHQVINAFYETPASLAILQSQQEYVMRGNDLRQNISFRHNQGTNNIDVTTKFVIFNPSTRKYETVSQTVREPLSTFIDPASNLELNINNIDPFKWKTYTESLRQSTNFIIENNKTSLTSTVSTDEL